MTKVHPAAYQPLLEVIAEGESGGNYDAYYSNGSNSTIRFTEMTLAEVLAWQDEFVAQGGKSSAVGKYQIIRPTLQGLIKQLKLDTSAKFDAVMQDRLAIALMERRGSVAFIDNEIAKDEFAHELSKEWAALPKVKGDNPDKSYYEGDGLNTSRISVQEISGALDSFEAAAKLLK